MNAHGLPMKRLLTLAAALAVAGCTGTTESTPSLAVPTIAVTVAPSPIATDGTETPAPSEVPSPTLTPIETPVPTASLPIPNGAWRPAPAQPSLTTSQLQDVAWTGSRFEAVAVNDTGGAFLDSTDGRTWHAHATGAIDGLPSRIAAGPGRLVVIGTVGGKPASWSSTDGSHWTWHSSNFPATLSGGDVLSVTDVVATSTGWLAVGRENPACNVACGTNPVRAMAWTSIDGLAWTRVSGQSAFEGGGIEAVAATGNAFIAVGLARGHAAIWRSLDGTAWSRITDDPMFGPPSGAGTQAIVVANGVAAGHGSVVAVGMAFDAGAGGAPIVVAWRSDDGLAWTAGPVEGAETGQVFSVAATTGRFLATGPSGVDSCLGGIWSSGDGARWACEATDPAFAGFGPYAAAGSPTIEVAVGLTSVGWDESGGHGLPGAVWWRAAP